MGGWGIKGCQRLIPLVLPEVTTLIQKLLSKGFPQAYQARLQEADAEHALVTQVWYWCISVYPYAAWDVMGWDRMKWKVYEVVTILGVVYCVSNESGFPVRVFFRFP